MDKDIIKFLELVTLKPVPEHLKALIKFLDNTKGKRLVVGRKGWVWIKDDRNS